MLVGFALKSRHDLRATIVDIDIIGAKAAIIGPGPRAEEISEAA
jgi:hypothetical protein